MAEGMTPERWREIERLYQLVQEREPGERDAFLGDACAGDEALREEVAALMANESRIDRLIESPAMDDAARGLARDQEQPTLAAGQMIAHYRVVGEIGHGGMGIVYRAEDSKLKRAVALKCLPLEFASDRERMARFEREARLLASLNHPNIGTIHGLEEAGGRSFLVLELVEGETLAEKIERGPLPVVETLNLCRQIAEGLEAAHERGIIHRDLKPANVRITPHGQAKILDFGLARRTPTQPQPELTEAPTKSTETEVGVVSGTVPYMSPEQVRGMALDTRTDIFSFGSVLYEMLSGRRPFEGETGADVIAAILNREPAPLPDLPAHVQELMERCLKKNPGQRFQSANDIAVALKALLESHLDDVPATKASPKRFRRLWILSVVTILIVIVLAAGVKFRNFLGAPRIQSIAVLPLVNLSGDPQQEYIADGITDELINELGQLSGLRVISHTSIMQYKKTTPPLSKIAKDLKVDAVLEGSVLLSGDRVEIRSRLVDTRTEKRLWGKPY